jgi:NAD(P)H-hydrate epimerase
MSARRASGAKAQEPIALDEAFAATLVPSRDVRAHKGTFGTALAVCGSLDYAGAAVLAGTAALRAGAGLVVLCVPASLQPIVAGRVPELITFGLPERAPFEVHPERAAAAVESRPHAALIVGPGLRSGEETDELVARLVRNEGGGGDAAPAVLDAEALNALSRTTGWWKSVGRSCVLTPHPGEFERLTGKPVGPEDEERASRAAEAARRWRQVVVLKGARTVIATPDGAIARAAFENPALATGGTGDVLAGTIGSLLEQGVRPWEAACLGVFLHGTAAEHVRERLGDAGLVASDLLAELPRVRRHLAQLRDRRKHAGQLGFMPRAASSGSD